MQREEQRKDDTEMKEKSRARDKGTNAGATRLAALGRLLVGDGLLLTHGRDDGDKEVLALIEVTLDLLAEIALRDLDVVLGRAVGGHEVEEILIDVDELVFVALHVRDVHVVRGGGDILLLDRQRGIV